MAGVDPSLTDFLQGNVIAQIVMDQLLDTIEGLRIELERTKHTNTSLATRLASSVRKRPASPTTTRLDEEEQRPRKQHDPDRPTRE
jgi:hypothetical protein